jgi:hypothetical protein
VSRDEHDHERRREERKPDEAQVESAVMDCIDALRHGHQLHLEGGGREKQSKETCVNVRGRRPPSLEPLVGIPLRRFRTDE